VPNDAITSALTEAEAMVDENWGRSPTSPSAACSGPRMC
jgi:hypothetical protein